MKRFAAIILLLAMLVGCGGGTSTPAASNSSDQPYAIEGLTYTDSMEILYAECFTAHHYEGGYTALLVDDGRRYLVVPAGAEIPAGAADYIVLQQPLENIYLAATAAMSLFDALDTLDCIRLSGTKESGWYIENAASAMAAGDILYAGKYSAPDYELLFAENCDLAIESTMIYHTPEVQEKLEELGIPVLIDRCSYESHPLGRTEWIKFYGALTGKEKQAAAHFSEQCSLLDRFSDLEQTGKTVAFFSVNSNGTVAVRKSNDYLPRMIEIAGGKHIFENIGDPESAASGVTLTMEEFYAAAKDADYILYNATISDPLTSVDDLLAKSELFADFKAVQEDRVWTTGKYLYQATDTLGSFIYDLNLMLSDQADSPDLVFIKKLS